MRPRRAPTATSRGIRRRRSPTVRRKLTAAITALPAGALGPFGPWATELGTAAFCLKWPSPAVATPPLGAGPLPDVPVLALSGGYDMRTPTSSAAAVIRLFPHGNLLVVPGYRPQRRRRRQLVLRDPRRALLGRPTGTFPPRASARPSSSRRPARIRPRRSGSARLAAGHARARRQDDQGGRGDVADDGIRLRRARSPGLVSGKLTPGASRVQARSLRDRSRVELTGRLTPPAPDSRSVQGNAHASPARTLPTGS